MAPTCLLCTRMHARRGHGMQPYSEVKLGPNYIIKGRALRPCVRTGYNIYVLTMLHVYTHAETVVRSQRQGSGSRDRVRRMKRREELRGARKPPPLEGLQLSEPEVTKAIMH